ncbi:MAG: hypothetical protein OXI08_01770 [Cyanobacteria bacterium MAG IRC4_bin_6]|nr:hypothetical protein [Cyanobacteria bacterium MAG IRC4_bin_6]
MGLIPMAYRPGGPTAADRRDAGVLRDRLQIIIEQVDGFMASGLPVTWT